MSLGPPKLPRDLMMGWPLFFKPPLPEDTHFVSSFSNSWGGDGVGFYLDQAARRVYLCGQPTASDEVATSNIFTLPEGYRPGQVCLFAVAAHDNHNNVWVSAVVRVATSGVVSLFHMTDFSQFVVDVNFAGQSTSMGHAGNCDQLSLDGISFRIP